MRVVVCVKALKNCTRGGFLFFYFICFFVSPSFFFFFFCDGGNSCIGDKRSSSRKGFVRNATPYALYHIVRARSTGLESREDYCLFRSPSSHAPPSSFCPTVMHTCTATTPRPAVPGRVLREMLRTAATIVRYSRLVVIRS